MRAEGRGSPLRLGKETDYFERGRHVISRQKRGKDEENNRLKGYDVQCMRMCRWSFI